MVKIRLARGGRLKQPVYTIVATDSRNPRDGRFIEKLGQYNPKAKELLIDIKAERIAAFVKNGAIISDTVKSLLQNHKITF